MVKGESFHLSPMTFHLNQLPARLLHARDFAFPGQFPETNTTGSKTPQKSPRPAAQLAAIMLAGGKFGDLQ